VRSRAWLGRRRCSYSTLRGVPFVSSLVWLEVLLSSADGLKREAASQKKYLG
jgi:hypothetical protein